MMAFQDSVSTITHIIALAIDLIALLVIAFATIVTISNLFLALIHRKMNSECIEQVRVKLGHSLVLGLEFLIGADILRTAVAPSWSSIGQLGAIVLLRTLLDYFLERELYSAHANIQHQHSASDKPTG